MNSIQSALQAALPAAMEQIRKDARKAAFERAAARGEALMLEATKATSDGEPQKALAAVRKDRYACAAYLAKALHRPLSAKDGRLSGFSELELMERFWAEKVAEQRAERQKALTEAAARKATVDAEVEALRKMGRRHQQETLVVA